MSLKKLLSETKQRCLVSGGCLGLTCKFWIVLFWHSEPCNINKFSLDDKVPKSDNSPESSAAARCPSVSYFKAPPPLDIHLKAVSRGMKSEFRSQTFNPVCSAFTYTIICSKPLLKECDFLSILK